MYSVIFDDEAIEFLNKIEKQLKEWIFNKISSTKEKPYRFFIRLSERNDYKLRVWDYRVIADINDKEQVIKVTLIGHRKNVYDK